MEWTLAAGLILPSFGCEREIKYDEKISREVKEIRVKSKDALEINGLEAKEGVFSYEGNASAGEKHEVVSGNTLDELDFNIAQLPLKIAETKTSRTKKDVQSQLGSPEWMWAEDIWETSLPSIDPDLKGEARSRALEEQAKRNPLKKWLSYQTETQVINRLRELVTLREISLSFYDEITPRILGNIQRMRLNLQNKEDQGELCLHPGSSARLTAFAGMLWRHGIREAAIFEEISKQLHAEFGLFCYPERFDEPAETGVQLH